MEARSTTGITRINIEDEMRTSYLDYAMSVIIGRALPDVRDGLKPVHRRVLYAMFREGLLHNKKYSKCAGVVGEVLKKYHPHGDSAVYDTLVRMAQPWNMRYQLVDGQGNFGSIDGDSAAAYRYTESRMTRLAEMMLRDIDRDTVDFVENYDGSTTEPVVLPTRFPTLLVNGSDGIAVGMATKIPPHNLREIINACIHLIDHPDATVRDMVLGRPANPDVEGDEGMKPIVPGPDFPTGGLILAGADLLKAYETGRGIIKVRGRSFVEEDENNGRQRLVISELPYQVNKARLVEKIAELVRDKKIEGIRDLRDESNREGIRVVIELKKEAHPEIILNLLYKHSPLQISFGIILLSIVRGQPQTLDLKSLLNHFIDHRREVTIRRCRFELRKAEHQAHILEGLKKAIDVIDEIIATIRASRTTAEAREALISKFEFSQIQAQAILELRLQKLTGLERDKILEELTALYQEIERLRSILSNEHLLLQLIKDELTEVRDDFGDERRSLLTKDVTSISEEDLIAVEDMVVTLTHTGYIKRNALSEYRAQRRGGRGVQGMNTKEEDFVVNLFVASTHDHVLIFTNQGRLHHLKVYQVPKASRTALGRPLVNLIKLEPDEKPTAVLPISEITEETEVFFATKFGTVKKTKLMSYANAFVRSSGLIAIKLDDGDELIGVDLTDGNSEILMGTRRGQAIRFQESLVRSMGRATRGVRGIKLAKDDEVVSLVVTDDTKEILTVTRNGYGKRTPVSDYRMTNRGGKGVITIKCSDRNGDVAELLEVSSEHQLMFTTNEGRVIRIYADEIRTQGRNTQGVRLFRIDKGEHITSVACLMESDDDDEFEEGEEGTEGEGKSAADVEGESASAEEATAASETSSELSAEASETSADSDAEAAPVEATQASDDTEDEDVPF
ncbi:MAG TPA: DNA gyrase subunit A [Myxococcales bacterium]|nr:DNA gyrase subunit A [Deltaproteobacteria bacterium]HAA54476.1 DNA gyrase subunit A [Myxococcales bacterium]|tara:strand:+ start:20326 stop:23040 length:2715 start_codon:yes stop_codon:yes gene_type:complete